MYQAVHHYRDLKKAAAGAAPDWRDPADRITAADVQRLRLDIRAKLEAGARDAVASRKPLRILVGEDHGDNRAFLKETLAVDEARRLGIRDLGVELPPGSLHDPQTGIAASAFSLHLLGNLFPDMMTHAIDTGRKDDGIYDPSGRISLDEMTAHRSQEMAKNIAWTDRSMIAVVGLGHVDQIVGDPAMKGSVVVSLDASSGFSNISTTALPLPACGDAREYAIGDLARMALDKKAAPLLRQMEKDGLANSQAGVKKRIASLENYWTQVGLRPDQMTELAAGYGELARLTGNQDFALRAADRFSLVVREGVSSAGDRGSALVDNVGMMLGNLPRQARTSPNAAPGWTALRERADHLDRMQHPVTSWFRRLLHNTDDALPPIDHDTMRELLDKPKSTLSASHHKHHLHRHMRTHPVRPSA